MAEYKFVNNSALRKDLTKFCQDVLNDVQKALKDSFTFDFRLIGSGNSKLLTKLGNDKSIDLDYNIIIKRDKRNLLSYPGRIRYLFIDAFKYVLDNYENVKVNNSKSVITTFVGNIDGYVFSFDCAIMFEGNDGCFYKIVLDKKSPIDRYIWCKVKNTKDFDYRYLMVKNNYNFLDIKKLYLKKKNLYKKSKSSYEVLAETINDLYQRI